MTQDLNKFFNETVAQLANDAGGMDETNLWSTVETDFRSKVAAGYFPSIDPLAQIIKAQHARWVDYSRSTFNRNLEALMRLRKEAGEGLWGFASKHFELPVRVNSVIIPTGCLTADDMYFLQESRRDNLKRQQAAFDKSEACTMYLVDVMSISGARVLKDAFIDA